MNDRIGARRLRTFVRSIIHLIVDFLFPPVCRSCQADIVSGGVLCAACFTQLRFIVPPFCCRCGEPFSEAGMDNALCVRCHEKREGKYRRIRSALIYNDAARRLIFPLKYFDCTENAAILGEFMLRAGHEL